MLQYFKTTPLSKNALLSAIVLILGVYLTVSGIFPLFIACWLFIITSALALTIQYNSKAISALFHPVTNKKTLLWIIPVVPFTLAISMFSSYLGTLLGQTSVANEALGHGDTTSKIINLLLISISLVGEEMITAAATMPFFSLLQKKYNQRTALILASIIGAILFGSMHVVAYDFNLYQCIVAVGLTRLPFNWLWFKSDSLWPGIIAHIIYDWALFIPMIIVSMA